MSKFTKRILAFVLTAVMIFSIVPAGVINASAAYGDTTSSYNYPIRKIANNGDPFKSNHGGVDFTIGRGTPVYSSTSGTVSAVYSGCKNYNGANKKSGCDCTKKGCTGKIVSYNGGGGRYRPGKYCSGGGNYVTIKNDDGKYCHYTHLDSVKVKKGDKVTPSTQIGTVGSSGCSTGAHLHFSVQSNNSGSTKYDPFKYIFPGFKIALSNNGSSAVNPKLQIDFAWNHFYINQCKVYFGTSTSSLRSITDNISKEVNSRSYDLGTKFGNLTKGTTYYVKLEVKKSGNTYTSPVYSFTSGSGNKTFLDYSKNQSNPNLTITLAGLTEKNNTYVKVKSNFNMMVNVQEIRYVYSTNQKDIVGQTFTSKIGKTLSGTQEKGVREEVNTGVKPQNLGGLNTNINNLKPGTTYYCCILVKANGKWWQSSTDASKIKDFTIATANDKPAAVTLNLEKTSADIGIGDPATVSWNDAKYNSSYKITLLRDGHEVHSKDNIQGFSYTFEGGYINTPGEYTAKLEATNNAGKTSAKNDIVFTVHDDVTVTFYADENCDAIAEQKSVHYGHSAEAPEPPQREGYEFAGWVNAAANTETNQNVTLDTELIPSYKIKTFNVEFVNGANNQRIGDVQQVEYGKSASAPVLPNEDGYIFAWDTDFSSVKNDITVKAVSSWYNKNYPLTVSTASSKFTRDTDGKGYDFSIKVIRDPRKSPEAITGRLVIALKDSNGYMFRKTESAAFNFGRNFDNNSEKDTIIVNGFVATETTADVIEVFTVKSYEDAGILAAPITINQENLINDSWSRWYTAEEWQNVSNQLGSGAIIQSREATFSRTREKITTTSTATSLEGYIRNDGYTLRQKSTGSVEYVKQWATYYKTGTTLYNKYNKSPMVASENATTKTVINGESVIGLIYWHWCRGNTSGRTNRVIASGDANDKKAGYTTFHAFYKSGSSKLKADTQYTNLAKNTSDSSGCKDSWLWWNKDDREHAPVKVYKQTYTVYDKVYSYYKWTDWTDWTETANSSTAQNTETRQTKTVTLYRYQGADVSNLSDYSANRLSNWINASNLKQLDVAFAGKEATVFIYKHTEPSDYTNEYIIKTSINSDGTIDLGDGYVREVPTYETGDFTIAAAIEGQSDLIEIGTIKAPPAQFSITFKLPDGTQIGETLTKNRGDTVLPPDETDFEIPEGMYLKGWNQSTANIQSDLIVEAVFAPKTYVVVFIDWGSKEFELKEYKYGDIIAIPGFEEVDGKIISWDLSGLNKVDEELKDDEGYPVLDEDGNAVINTYYTVKGNAVVTTDYVDQVNEARFILPKTEDSRDLIDSLDDAYEKADELVVDEEGNKVAKKDTPEFAGENGIIDNLLKEADISDGTEVIGDIKYNDYIPINDEINEIMDNDEVYLFYGWRSVKTGEFLNDLTSEKATDTYYPSFDFGRTVEVPEASVETGEYDDTQSVTLSCGTENAVIYYTLDGSDPRDVNNANVHQYNGTAITISRSTTLTAYAAAMNYNDSDLGTYLYAIGGTYHVLIVYNDSNIEGDNALVTLQRDNTRLPSDAYRTLDGHTFEEIYTDAEHTDEFDYESEFVSSDLVDEETGLIELYAHYIPDSYNITFADDTGRVLKETTAFWGEKAEEPEESELAKEGYVFVGWNSDDYTFVTEDGVFTAKYVREDEYAKISFKRTKYSILANSDKQIAYTITPAELSGTEIDWETDNRDVATVDYKGVVTGVNPGTATIKATVRTTGESASAVITVSEDPDQVVTLAKGSSLGLDSQGNIRGLDADKNTVNEIKDEFISENIKFFDCEGNELTGEDKIGTGALVRLLDDDGATVLSERVIILTGDADCDGYITNRDSGYIARFLVEKETANTYQMIALDVNGDGDVNVRDASMLAQYLVGKATLVK